MYRANAINSIATAKKLGMLGSEAALVLNGTTGYYRAAAIAYIAPFLKPGIAATSLTVESPVAATPTATSPTASSPVVASGVPSTANARPNPSSAGGQPPAAQGSTAPSGCGAQQPIFSTTIPTTTAGSTPATAPTAKLLPKLLGSDLTDTAAAYEFALLANAVYGGTTPVGLQTRNGEICWRQLDRQIQTYLGTSFNLGFKASTYLRRSDVKGEWLCAVVFAGTDGPDPVDWASNINQALGHMIQEYEQGADYAKKIADGVCKGRELTFVGHSLGGGIAQYAFARTQAAYPNRIFKARTFNAAGLSWMKEAEWKPYVGAANVINFIAESYDAADGKKLVGFEPASRTGVLIGRPILVPVYGKRFPHLISVIQEGVGIQRDYCLAAGDCL